MSNPGRDLLEQAYLQEVGLTPDQQRYHSAEDLIATELRAVMGNLFVACQLFDLRDHQVSVLLTLVGGASVAIRYCDDGLGISWRLTYCPDSVITRGRAYAHALPMTEAERHDLRVVILKVALHR